MKMLETCLSGFESMADCPKPENLQKYEAWTQIATPPTLVDENATGAFEAHSSGFDGVLILETPDEECKRRATGRKIDPTTQTVYHMETEAPEDAKVLDRLQDYTDAAGDSERMQRISTGFEQAITSIKQWLTKFGLKDANNGECSVQLDMSVMLEAGPQRTANEEQKSQVSIVTAGGDGEEAAAEPEAPKNPWGDKKSVLDCVLHQVDRVMAFRQREYNALRDQARTSLEEQERIRAEEEKRAAEAAEAEAKKEGTADDAVGSQASLAKQELNAEEESKRPASQEKVPSSAHEQLEIEVEQLDDNGQDPMQTMNSSRRLLSEHGHSVGGTSKSIGRSTKFMQRIQELSERQKITKWEEM